MSPQVGLAVLTSRDLLAMTWEEVAYNEGHDHVLSNEVVKFLIFLAEQKVVETKFKKSAFLEGDPVHKLDGSCLGRGGKKRTPRAYSALICLVEGIIPIGCYIRYRLGRLVAGTS